MRGRAAWGLGGGRWGLGKGEGARGSFRGGPARQPQRRLVGDAQDVVEDFEAERLRDEEALLVPEVALAGDEAGAEDALKERRGGVRMWWCCLSEVGEAGWAGRRKSGSGAPRAMKGL